MTHSLLAFPILLGLLAGQMPSKPPMKMGLWETATNTTMSMPGVSLPSGMGNRVTTAHSCATPESYAEAFQQQQQRASCERSNQTWSGNTYSFDITCSGSQAKGHFEMTFDSPENGHGTLHIESAVQDHSMTMDMTMKTHWLSADCGNVAPGKAVIIQRK